MPRKRERIIDSITTRYHEANDPRSRGQIKKEARAAGVRLPAHTHDIQQPTKQEIEHEATDDTFKMLAAIAIGEHETPVSLSELSRSAWEAARPARNIQARMESGKTAERLRAFMTGVAFTQAQLSEQPLDGAWTQWEQRPSGSALTPVINKFFLPTDPVPAHLESRSLALTPTDDEPLVRVGENIFAVEYDRVIANHQTGPTTRLKLAHRLSLSVVRYDYFQTQDLGDLRDEETMELFEEMYLTPALEGDEAAQDSIHPIASTLVATKTLSRGSQV